MHFSREITKRGDVVYSHHRGLLLTALRENSFISSFPILKGTQLKPISACLNSFPLMSVHL